MKNRKQKYGMMTLALLLAVTMLAGCVGNYVKQPTTTPAPATTAAPAPTTAPATTASPGGETTAAPETTGGNTPATEAGIPDLTGTTLEVWYAVSGTSGELFTKMSEQFAKESGATLNLSYSGGSGDTATKVSAAQLTGTAPDVALMYAGPLYTGGQGNYMMDEMMNRGDAGFDKADIFPGMLDYCTYMGQGICAVPFGISTQVLYYNKDILAAAGVDMTNPPETWEEFAAVLGTVMEKGNISGNAEFTAFDTTDEAWLFKSMLMQNGCQIVENEEGHIKAIFNNEQAVEVANYWYSLVEKGYMAAGEHNNAENKFLSGNLAFVAASSNRISRWTGTTSFELGAIEMPCFTQRSLALGGNVIVILTEDPVRAAAAWQYITYLTNVANNTEFALGTGYLPIHKSALEQDSVKKAIEDNEMYGVAFKQLDYTWAYTHFEQMGTMDVQIKSMLTRLEKGRGDAQDLLNKAVKTLQDEIDNQ